MTAATEGGIEYPGNFDNVALTYRVKAGGKRISTEATNAATQHLRRSI
jgi:hypothetical protein